MCLEQGNYYNEPFQQMNHKYLNLDNWIQFNIYTPVLPLFKDNIKLKYG